MIVREQDGRAVMLKDRGDHGPDRQSNAGVIAGPTVEMYAEALLIEVRNPQIFLSLIATRKARQEKVPCRRYAVQFLPLQGAFVQHQG